MVPNVFFLGLLAGFLCPTYGQYSMEEFTPIEGPHLADCLFYADHVVVCAGRLGCDPAVVRYRNTAAELDSVCPRDVGLKLGTWTNDQVIPSSATASSGNSRVARCQFFANNGKGALRCTGSNLDTWRATYTGTINTLFAIGSPRPSSGTSGNQPYNPASPTNPAGSTGATSTFQVTMCSYKGDGTGKCRECTEAVTGPQHMYTCSGPEEETTWTERSGFMPAGLRPDRYSTSQRVVASCIFRPSTSKFDCYAGLSDGSCTQPTRIPGQAPVDASASMKSCFAGDTWTGRYSGSVYN